MQLEAFSSWGAWGGWVGEASKVKASLSPCLPKHLYLSHIVWAHFNMHGTKGSHMASMGGGGGSKGCFY
jgi:hypothetical protein